MARSRDLADLSGLSIISATIESRFRDAQKKAGLISCLTLFGPTAPLDPVPGEPPLVATLREVARLYRMSNAAGDYDRSTKLLDMLLKNLALWENTLTNQLAQGVKIMVERARVDAMADKGNGGGLMSEADLMKVISGGEESRNATIREAAAHAVEED